uniref:Salivary kazaltype proteinase inhibitor n=1 Tax=Triatoma matogrossensis TaxID=162370 RepID=E2J792_9HEMI
MRFSTSVFSVVVIAVFLCMLDKPVLAEVRCDSSCPLEYNPVCGYNGQEYVRFVTMCDLERTNSCKNRGEFKVIEGECPTRQAFTPPT